MLECLFLAGNRVLQGDSNLLSAIMYWRYRLAYRMRTSTTAITEIKSRLADCRTAIEEATICGDDAISV